MHIISMCHMALGQTGFISRIENSGETTARITEMGLVPGEAIQIVGRGPFNDPLLIKLRGHNLTLRNSEADRIMVETEPWCADGKEAASRPGNQNLFPKYSKIYMLLALVFFIAFGAVIFTTLTMMLFYPNSSLGGPSHLTSWIILVSLLGMIASGLLSLMGRLLFSVKPSD